MAKYSLRNYFKSKKLKQKNKKHKQTKKNKKHHKINKKHKKVITRKLKNKKYQVLQKGGNELGTWVGVPNPYDPTGYGWAHKSFMFKCPS
tara:strand:- start:1003 stop:1272 length:270 start_codon:yes stop_codon:yes gene_type:complete